MIAPSAGRASEAALKRFHDIRLIGIGATPIKPSPPSACAPFADRFTAIGPTTGDVVAQHSPKVESGRDPHGSELASIDRSGATTLLRRRSTGHANGPGKRDQVAPTPREREEITRILRLRGGTIRIPDRQHIVERGYRNQLTRGELASFL